MSTADAMVGKLVLGMLMDTYLGAEPDGTYELPEIDLAKLNVSTYTKLLDETQKRFDNLDFYELNWIDMQEQMLHELVNECVQKLRVFALTTAPNHPMHMSNREFIAAAEISQMDFNAND